MMQTGQHCQRNTENTGVNVLYNSEASKDSKNHLFNKIDKLAVDHDVTVSSTMIKVTYHKGIKDQSITSMCRNEFENKQHSVICKPALTGNYNHKLSTGGKNHSKSFDDIVFIPKHVEVTGDNKASLKKKIYDVIRGDYATVLKEEKRHFIAAKKSLNKKPTNIINSGFNNYLHNTGQYHQLQQFKIILPRMNSIDSQTSGSPINLNHIREEEPNHRKSEVNSKKFLKNDVNESKDFSFSDNLKIHMKKDKVNLNISQNLDKERLKSIKNKDENFKKKRPASEEGLHNQNKKLKSSSDISGKHVKDKVNVGKVKEKKANVNQKEKKTPSKTTSITEETFKDCLKRELLREDPNLPSGWKRIIRGKQIGNIFRPVICIASPEGRKFYFRAQLKEYLERTNSHLTIDDFHFGLYEKSHKEKVSDGQGNKKVNTQGKKIVTKRRKRKSEDRGPSEQENKKIKRLDNTNSFSEPLESNHDSTCESQGENNRSSGEKSDETKVTGNIVKKNLLLVDPDLPPGWVRKVRVRNDVEGPDKFQVWVISPEGRKFKRKYLLQQHLLKTRSPLDISQFYFGLYPRKEGLKTPPPLEPDKQGAVSRSKNQGKMRNSSGSARKEMKKTSSKAEEANSDGGDYSNDELLSGGRQMSLILTKIDDVGADGREQPLLEDPNLPPGWRRFIKVRSMGESAGKLEVIIVSPDGRRHRSRGRLEEYIKQKGLDFKVDDFDFSVCGKNSKRSSATSLNTTPLRSKSLEPQIVKKKDSPLPLDQSFPRASLDHSSQFNEAEIPREALMINYVSGIMLNCGLRDLRGERRLRIPREEQEKVLKKYLESESGDAANDDSDISSNWVQRLIHCRSDFGDLDVDAASTIANLTKEFLRDLTRHALKVSKSERSLEYGDLAELVDKSERLSPLRSLIPKKITFREFIRLNRPKRFSSFT